MLSEAWKVGKKLGEKRKHRGHSTWQRLATFTQPETTIAIAVFDRRRPKMVKAIISGGKRFLFPHLPWESMLSSWKNSSLLPLQAAPHFIWFWLWLLMLHVLVMALQICNCSTIHLLSLILQSPSCKPAFHLYVKVYPDLGGGFFIIHFHS